MTKRQILTKANNWPMYAHELGGNEQMLYLLVTDGLLSVTRGVSDNRMLYTSTDKGRRYLEMGTSVQLDGWIRAIWDKLTKPLRRR